MTTETSLALASIAAALCGCFNPNQPADNDAESGGSSGDPSTTGGMTSTGPTSLTSTSATTTASTVTDPTTTTQTGPSDDSSDTGPSSSEETGSTSDPTTSEAESSSESGMAMCVPFDADAGTIALWHLDDAAGQTAADAAGGGRELQLGAAAGADAQDPSWGTGRFDGGLAFTSANEEYATRDAGGNTFANNELTVELWVRTLSTDYAQVFTAGFINCFVAVNNNGSGIEWGVGDGNNWSFLTAQQPNGTLNDGLWHYIAVTYDGATMRAFVDGMETGSAAAATILAAPGDYKVGGRPFNTFLEGDMDEVRLSDVARTADEIAAAYDGCE